jgi:hypothetical protein
MRRRLALVVVSLAGVAAPLALSGPAAGSCLPLLPCVPPTTGGSKPPPPPPPPPETRHMSKLVGLADNQAAMFDNPYFKGLGAGWVRLIVPWDQEIRPHAFVTEWLKAAQLQRRKVLAVFGIGGCGREHCTGQEYRGTNAQYERGVRLFVQRHPWIKYYSTFNEPNEGWSRMRGHLEDYTTRYIFLSKLCQGRCTNVGGEVALGERIPHGGREQSTNWGLRFMADLKRRKALRYAPRIWGLHNYVDVNRREVKWTRSWMKAFKGTIWFTETGALMNRPGGRLGFPDSRPAYTYPCLGTEECQNIAMRFLLLHMRGRLPQGRSRVQRIFVYQMFANGAPDGFDSGLLNTHLQPRAAYKTVQYAALHS